MESGRIWNEIENDKDIRAAMGELRTVSSSHAHGTRRHCAFYFFLKFINNRITIFIFTRDEKIGLR